MAELSKASHKLHQSLHLIELISESSLLPFNLNFHWCSPFSHKLPGFRHSGLQFRDDSICSGHLNGCQTRLGLGNFQWERRGLAHQTPMVPADGSWDDQVWWFNLLLLSKVGQLPPASRTSLLSCMGCVKLNLLCIWAATAKRQNFNILTTFTAQTDRPFQQHISFVAGCNEDPKHLAV